MNEQPNSPDMIAQAGELLRRFQYGADLTNWTEPHVDRHDIVTGESAIVIASAVLAVAGELRELRNVLAMAMEPGTDEAGDPTAALRTVSLK